VRRGRTADRSSAFPSRTGHRPRRVCRNPRSRTRARTRSSPPLVAGSCATRLERRSSAVGRRRLKRRCAYRSPGFHLLCGPGFVLFLRSRLLYPRRPANSTVPRAQRTATAPRTRNQRGRPESPTRDVAARVHPGGRGIRRGIRSTAKKSWKPEANRERDSDVRDPAASSVR
jgi:hypothetical protein